MSSGLPEAAVRAGAEFFCVAFERKWFDASYDECELLARAVLVAATEKRTCWDCKGQGEVYAGSVAGMIGCRECNASGFLYVLKQSESE